MALSEPDPKTQLFDYIVSNPECATLIIETAIKTHNINIVAILLNAGVNVNTNIKISYYQYNQNLLFFAITKSNTEMVELLLSHNPDLFSVSSYTSNWKMTPIELIMREKNISMFKLIIDHFVTKYNIDTVLQELEYCNLMVYTMIAYTKRNMSNTPDNQLLIMLQYLMDHGSDPNLAINRNNYCYYWRKSSAFEFAKVHKWDDIVELFTTYEYSMTKGVQCDDSI